MTFGGCKDETGPSNTAPTISSVVVNPATVPINGTATVTVTAQDQDGDPLSYAYVPNGGAVSGTGSVVTWTAPGTAGAYSVAVTVSDGEGGEATQSGTLTVAQGVTQIVGTASLQVGQAGDLSNARAAIYANLTDWNADLPALFTAVTGSGSSVSFTIANMPAGTYYLDVWKDSDNSGSITSGDFFGVYGSGVYPNYSLTPIAISDGQTVNVTITVVIL